MIGYATRIYVPMKCKVQLLDSERNVSLLPLMVVMHLDEQAVIFFMPRGTRRRPCVSSPNRCDRVLHFTPMFSSECINPFYISSFYFPCL